MQAISVCTLGFLIFLGAAFGGQAQVGPDPACIDFEGLPDGEFYLVGESFTDSGVTMKVEQFQWSIGIWFAGGIAEVGTQGQAGHTGQELNLNNVNLSFDFRQCVGLLTLSFGEYGGNLNISINGDFRNFENMADIDGMVVGGVNVSVTGGFGGDSGTLSLHGEVASLAVGGQELWIDHVCYAPCPPEPSPLRITDIRRLSATRLRIAFEDIGADTLIFELQVAPVAGSGAPWSTDTGATIMPGAGIGEYHAETDIPAAQESYYRVKGTKVGGS